VIPPWSRGSWLEGTARDDPPDAPLHVAGERHRGWPMLALPDGTQTVQDAGHRQDIRDLRVHVEESYRVRHDASIVQDILGHNDAATVGEGIEHGIAETTARHVPITTGAPIAWHPRLVPAGRSVPTPGSDGHGGR
jgi:hypothetical protein